MRNIDLNIQRSVIETIKTKIADLPGYIDHPLSFWASNIKIIYKTWSEPFRISFDYSIKFELLQEHVMAAINNDVLIYDISFTVAGRPGEWHPGHVTVHASINVL